MGVRESSSPLQYRTAEECLASESILSHSNDLLLLGYSGAECSQCYGFLVGHSVPKVGSVGSAICKYSLSLLVTREHLERALEAGEEPQDSLFML